jgi:hypothetical protein
VHFGFSFGDFIGNPSSAENALRAQYLFNAALLAAECVLEPLYVAAGFTLYLSRRTALEGWDLEIAFRRLAARREKPGAAALVVLLGLALVVSTADPAQAATTEPGAGAQKAAIAEILKSPEFREYEDTRVWRRKGGPPDETPEIKSPDINLDFLAKLARVLAELFRIVAWGAAIFVAGWLLYQISRRLGWFRGALTRDVPWRPEVLFGMDLRPESLPADIAAAARERLGADDIRGALSLLYRGALAHLINERNLVLSMGDTEGDCLRRVCAGAPAPMAGYFGRLVEAWGLVAYARRAPAGESVTRLISEWEQHFEMRKAPAARSPA